MAFAGKVLDNVVVGGVIVYLREHTTPAAVWASPVSVGYIEDKSGKLRLSPVSFIDELGGEVPYSFKGEAEFNLMQTKGAVEYAEIKGLIGKEVDVVFEHATLGDEFWKLEKWTMKPEFEIVFDAEKYRIIKIVCGKTLLASQIPEPETTFPYDPA